MIGDLGSGGSQRVLTTVANTWSRAGLDVAVITHAPSDQDFFALDSRITRLVIGQTTVSRNPIAAVLANLLRIRSLRRQLRRARASTVVSFIAEMNILTILATRGLPMRVVVSERNDPARQPLARPWGMLRRFSYRFADVVTANSHGAIETLAAYVQRHKLEYVPNPVTVPVVAPADVPRSSILTVGSLTMQKAQEVLLRAFATISDDLPDWHLVVVGEGPREGFLRAEASRLGTSDRVLWIGSTREPFSYYQAADVFALPSRFEGTPNVVIEAMACGLPCVVTDSSGGALELVTHEESGLVVPADDHVALASALRRLATEPSLRDRLGRAAKGRVGENALPRVMARWEEVVRPRSRS